MQELDITSLIDTLTALKDKGYKTVEIKGTLMCSQDGNTIIATTENQQ